MKRVKYDEDKKKKPAEEEPLKGNALSLLA